MVHSKNLLLSRVKQLYVPYVVFYLIIYLYWLIIERPLRSISVSRIDALLGLFWGSDNNYWIFPGINYSPSYCLQGFLDVLCLRDIKWNNEFSRKAHLLIQFILQISDDIVHKLGYGTDKVRETVHGSM